MPRKHSAKVLASTEKDSAKASRLIRRKGQPRRGPKLKRRRRVADTMSVKEEEPRAHRRHSIMRTRRLLMAALRVWELRHGIRDDHWVDFRDISDLVEREESYYVEEFAAIQSNNSYY